MLKKQSDQKSCLLPPNNPLISACLYAYAYVSNSRAYMLPTSTNHVFVPNVKSCIKSSLSSVTVPSVPSVCLTTSVHNNVIKKPLTCCDSTIKHPRKCLHKRTILKNRNTVNYVSKSVNNVFNCSCYFSASSSGFVCQPAHFNKSVHKHISSSFNNKPSRS